MARSYPGVAPRIVAVLAVAVAAAGCGEKREPAPGAGAVAPSGATGSPAARGATGPSAPDRGAARPVQLGISEFAANLIKPGPVPPGFGAYRDALASLRPDRYRLVVDWSALQPRADAPIDVAVASDGCVRGRPPCAPGGGLRANLEAVRDAQRAAGGGWEVMVAVYGVPAWAATPASGCERRRTQPRARPITPEGLEGYRALIRRVRALGEEVGVPLRWWAPWNEPNHPAFISPQRTSCSAGTPSLSPAVYGRLVGAAREELAGSGAKLVLGELAGFRGPREQGTGVGEFIRALPDEVACAAGVWSQHEYASPEDEPAAPFARDAVAEAEAALAGRPCTADLRLWVTETGVGGARSGQERRTRALDLARQCSAQAARLERWAADPKVQAVFQYTFREDPAYPVGLADPGLQVLYPTHRLWQAWADARGQAPPRPAGCGGG